MQISNKRILTYFCIVSLIVVGLFLYRSGKKSIAEQEQEKEQQVPVVVTPVQTRNFEERLEVQGTLEAKNFAVVSARVPGAIEKIFVDEGDMVHKDKTMLFEIDSMNLRKKVEMERQELSVMEYERIQAEANLERVQADFHKAQIDYERFKRLLAKKAVTAEAVEQKESRYRQVKAQIRLTKASIDLAKEKEQKSKTALAIAEKDLRDASVYAPITGKVSMRLHEKGEIAQPGMTILKIEDTSLIEVSAFLPAHCYSRIIPGETTMSVKAYGDEVTGQVIIHKGPTINPKLRTFEVKCRINDPPANFVPGALADIAICLQQRWGPGVPTEAIQVRGGKPILFTVEADRAKMLEVNIGLETDGWTQITSPPIQEDTPVVTMGQFLITNGTAVRVQRRSK